MAFYQDPDKLRHRPSLIEDLFKRPTKPGLHPLEDQCTATLAWLIDRSPRFAREFVALYVGEIPEGTIGARTWLRLPNSDGNDLLPDLCIELADGKLQLLVEVKVAAGLASYECSDGVTRWQDEMYRWAWAALPGPHAAVRAVGTLTRGGGTTTTDPANLKAADVTWSTVRDLIERLAEGSGFEPETEIVAQSFLRAIKKRVAVETPPPDYVAAWLATHGHVATQIATNIRDRIPGAKMRKTGGATADFVGHRVYIPNVMGTELRLRVYVTPSGAPQNLFEEPDALIVGIERDANGNLEVPASDIFDQAGFPSEKDIAGDWMNRRAWTMEDTLTDPAATAASIWDSLSATNVGPWATDRRLRQHDDGLGPMLRTTGAD